MLNKIRIKRLNFLNLLFLSILLLHLFTFFFFTLEKNILFNYQNILSENIYLNNFNTEYLNFKNYHYLFDFGSYIPISIIIFTFAYIGSKSQLTFITLSVSVLFILLISFFRTSTFEVLLFIFVALFFYFFVEKNKNIQNLFLIYFFCYLLILIVQRRIFINQYSLTDNKNNFQGEIVVALLVSLFFFIFISKKQTIYVFVISFILSLVLNPISYSGGLYCCGSSSYEADEVSVTISGYQWENFGIQERESPRVGDYFSIESLSTLENPYDNKSTTYPPFSLVLTKTIDALGRQINFFDFPDLNYAFFLLLVLMIFLFAFSKIQKFSVLKNFIVLGSFIILSCYLIDKNILLNLSLKTFLLFLFFRVNFELKISQSNYPFFLIALSFPLIYSVERGNIDTIIFPLVILFLISFLNKKYYFASFILSILGSLKIFPLVLLLLFFNKKNYIFSIFTLIQTFIITQASFLIYNLKFEGYINLFNNYIFINDIVFHSNPINYSSYSSSFTSFVKQYMSFLNLGFIYGETSVNGFYDVKSSFGIWTTMWMFPRIKFFLIMGLIFYCLIYVYKFRTISSLEFTIMINIIFLVFIDLNPSYRFSVIVVLLIVYSSISKLDIKIPILLLLLPFDLFFFPTHLTIVNSSFFAYYPILIYLFKKVSNKKTNVNSLKIE